MEASSVTWSSLWGLSIHSKDLWRLVLRVLSKVLGVPPGLLKKFQMDEYVGTPATELEIVAGTLPELPLDVLTVIFATLDIPDLVRAGAVCSSWQAAYTRLRNLELYKQSQTPCLFYTSESYNDTIGCIYSLVEKREYKLPIPEPPIRRRFIIGSSNGWLITADEKSELHLLNPFTGEQVALPSVITLEHVKPIFDDSGTVHKYELSYYTGEEVYQAPEVHDPNDLRQHCYYKAFVFPEASTGSYIVVLVHNPYGQLSFARPGDKNWTWLPPNADYRDCTYKDGLLYGLTLVGQIDAFDLTGSTVIRKVILPKVRHYNSESMYLIPAPWGDLLQVWRTVGKRNDMDDDALRIVNAPEQEDEDATPLLYVTHEIQVSKVDMVAKHIVKIDSLPHHMLFLGHNRSLCLSAADHPQLEANHAYYTDDHEELIMIAQNDARDIGVINLENHKRKEVVSQLWSDWPCPTWIIPNLTKMNVAFGK